MDLKEQRPWYENVLLLAVAGSIIAVIGQLAGTIIPIMYGPEDISDFFIELNQTETYKTVDIQECVKDQGGSVPNLL